MGDEMTRDILVRIAGDVGYLRSSVETLVEANLPNRMSFIEGQQKVNSQRIHMIETRRDKLVARTLVALTTLAALIGAAFTAINYLT